MLGRLLLSSFLVSKEPPPKFCCWVLTVNLAISEVFRSQTGKMRLGQISLIFLSVFWKEKRKRILLLNSYCTSSNFRGFSVPNNKWDLGRFLLCSFLFSTPPELCCWTLIVNLAISGVSVPNRRNETWADFSDFLFSEKKKQKEQRILLLNSYCKSSNFWGFSVPNEKHEMWADLSYFPFFVL